MRQNLGQCERMLKDRRCGNNAFTILDNKHRYCRPCAKWTRTQGRRDRLNKQDEALRKIAESRCWSEAINIAREALGYERIG